MLSAIEAFVNFVIGSSPLSRAFRWILAIATTIAAIMLYAVYAKTGTLSLLYLLDKDFMYTLFVEHRRTIIAFLLLENIFFVSVIIYLDYQIRNRKNCGVQYVALQDLAKLWLSGEEYRKAIESEVSASLTPANEKEIVAIPSFFKERSRKLFDDVILPQIDKFSAREMEIIADLLKLLEENPTPSVVSYFNEDPNKKDYGANMVTKDKTSYDILSEIDLYTHTLNAVDKAIEILRENYGNEYYLYLPRTLIAVLAHDIGKIQKMHEKVRGVSLEIFKKQPHHIISMTILNEKYPDYEGIAEIVDAVKKHHGHYKDEQNEILKILIQADKKAREEEIRKWLIEHKAVKEEKQNKQIETKEDKQNGSVPKQNETNDTKREESKSDKKEQSISVDMQALQRLSQENSEDEEKATSEIPTYKENKHLQSIPRSELDVDEILAEVKRLLHEKREYLCRLNKGKRAAIDFNFAIPHEDTLFVSFHWWKDILEEITGESFDESKMKPFLASLIDKGVIIYADKERGFYATKAIINAYDAETRVFGTFLPCRKLGFTLNEFDEIKKGCKDKVYYSIEIPNLE